MTAYPEYTSQEFISKVGNTPLIKHESLSTQTGRNILFKLESTNPGRSIKDRAVTYLLEDAIDAGLPPGGTLCEATAGNTGIALALLARSYDPPYKVRLFVPDVLIQDKITLLESLGCTVVRCRSDVDANHPEFFNTQAKAYSKEHEGCIFVNQMDNTSNRRAHFETTGPEIWEQLEGKIDGFIASAGTGGTLAGVSSFLKTKNPDVVCWAADRDGSGLTSYVTSRGENWEAEGSSFVEGIGKKSLTGQMYDILDLVSSSVTVGDTETIIAIYKLFHEQGIWIGPSAGLNVVAASRLALTLPEGSNVVTTAADGPWNYSSKLFNKEWLQENGHWHAIPEDLRRYAT
jgi:cysteine synthase A